jgi:hypothetical protein
MTWGMVAMGGATLVGGWLSSRAQRSAGNAAAGAQEQAAQLGIDEQHREFEALQKLLSPFATGGTAAFGAQQALIGLNGPQAQQAAITALQNQPQFQSELKAGQNAILQNASATGGLRGGNTQGALASFAPNLLAQVIQQQFGNLGGLASVGQNAAAMTGNAGMQMGNNITGLLGNIGSAQAGAALNSGAATQGLISSFLSSLGMFRGLGGGTAGIPATAGAQGGF